MKSASAAQTRAHNSRSTEKMAQAARNVKDSTESKLVDAEAAKAAKKNAKRTLKMQAKTEKASRPRKVRLDVHGRPKPLMRGWIHAGATPLALAGGIVAICVAPFGAMKAACAIYMTASLILFGNSACYHLGDWSPKVTDVLRRIDHMNIFLLIAGTYTPMAFALDPLWRNTILIALWSCTGVALIIHLIWISAPRWVYTITYIVFGVSGVGFLPLYWVSPLAGPAVVWLIAAGGAIYILGAIVYGKRWPDPSPKIFGFHEIFHSATVMGYACHMVAIFLVISKMRGMM